MPDYAGWALGVINADPAVLDSASERVNITLPRRVPARLDAQARAAGETRSGYVATLPLNSATCAQTYTPPALPRRVTRPVLSLSQPLR